MDQLKIEKWKELLALARKGDADAQHQVGYYFQYGTVSGGGKALVTPDAQKAFAWYEESAKQGNAHAQCAWVFC